MCDDGPWLFLPKAQTKHKNNPEKIPLNRLAAEALHLDVTYLHGRRIFENWHDGEVLGDLRRKVQQAGITNLCFHDLRHSFSTALENLGVDTRTIDLLMGHKVPGIGETIDMADRAVINNCARPPRNWILTGGHCHFSCHLRPGRYAARV